MTKTIRFSAHLTPEQGGGFTVGCHDFDVKATGRTEEEALTNFRMFVEAYLSTLTPSARTEVWKKGPYGSKNKIVITEEYRAASARFRALQGLPPVIYRDIEISFADDGG